MTSSTCPGVELDQTVQQLMALQAALRLQLQAILIVNGVTLLGIGRLATAALHNEEPSTPQE